MALESVLDMSMAENVPPKEAVPEEPDLEYVGRLPTGDAGYISHSPSHTPPNETRVQVEGYENPTFVKEDDETIEIDPSNKFLQPSDLDKRPTEYESVTPTLTLRPEPDLELAEEYEGGARPKNVLSSDSAA